MRCAVGPAYSNRMVIGCTYPIWCPHYPPMTSPYSRMHSVSFATTTSAQRSLILVIHATYDGWFVFHHGCWRQLTDRHGVRLKHGALERGVSSQTQHNTKPEIRYCHRSREHVLMALSAGVSTMIHCGSMMFTYSCKHCHLDPKTL